MKFTSAVLATAGILLAAPTQAAQAVSEFGFITHLFAGLKLDTVAVHTTAPLANPGCPVTDAGYATDPNDPGNKLFHAVLLVAFVNNKQVQITVDNAPCAFSKPHIIGVMVRER
jgi:hypothetical protein